MFLSSRQEPFVAKASVNAICQNIAQENKNFAPKMCLSVTPKNATAAKLIVIKARVDRITTNAKFYGVRLVRHLINVMIRTRTEVDMETADMID